MSIVDYIQSALGVYTPVMTDVLDESGTVIGQVVASGLAGVDFPYIARLVLLCLLIYIPSRFLYAGLFGRNR